MDKFTKITGVAAPMSLINTDMIFSRTFLKTIERLDLGREHSGFSKPDFRNSSR